MSTAIYKTQWMVWDCISASVVGDLIITDRIMNAER